MLYSMPIIMMLSPYCLQHTLSDYTCLAEVHDQELAYVAEQIAIAPDNESAWNYLWGLYTLPGCGKHDMGKQQKVGNSTPTKPL